LSNQLVSSVVVVFFYRTFLLDFGNEESVLHGSDGGVRLSDSPTTFDHTRLLLSLSDIALEVYLFSATYRQARILVKTVTASNRLEFLFPAVATLDGRLLSLISL
jgi:hypothetical protein